MTQTMILAALAVTLAACSPPKWQADMVHKQADLYSQIYDAEVGLYGKPAVMECRSRMSSYSESYYYCLRLESGRQ